MIANFFSPPGSFAFSKAFEQKKMPDMCMHTRRKCGRFSAPKFDTASLAKPRFSAWPFPWPPSPGRATFYSAANGIRRSNVSLPHGCVSKKPLLCSRMEILLLLQ